MTKKRLLILTGSGATISWGAKKTTEITDILKNCDVFKTKSNINVGQKIYDELEKYYKNKDLITFETIINVVETLYYYYFNKNYEDASNSYLTSELPSIFFEKCWCDDLFYFEYSETELNSVVSHFNRRNTSESVHLLWIYQYYIHLVVKEVKRYSNNIKNPTDKVPTYNELLYRFFKRLDEQYIIRSYTLNYDNLVKQICNGKEMFFDGFKVTPFENNGNSFYKADLEKIITDKTSNICYNLHGSAYYNFLEDKGEQEYYKTDEVILEKYTNESIDSRNNLANSGEFVLNSRIITGYKKLQRTFTEPFKAFNYSFYTECMDAEVALIIGYSFSDPHINSCLKHCIINECKIIIVDFIEGSIQNDKLFRKLKSQVLNNYAPVIPSDFLVTESDQYLQVFADLYPKMYVYYRGYNNFLDNKEIYKLFENN